MLNSANYINKLFEILYITIEFHYFILVNNGIYVFLYLNCYLFVTWLSCHETLYIEYIKEKDILSNNLLPGGNLNTTDMEHSVDGYHQNSKRVMSY